MRNPILLRLSLLAAALGAALSASAQNLVANNSFEANDFTGYTTTGSPLVATAINGPNGQTLASDGNVFVAIGFGAANERLSQALATQAGRSYVVGFDLNPLSGFENNVTPTSSALVTFGATTILSLTSPAPTADYVRYRIPVTSLAGNDVLRFSFVTPLGSEGYYALDNLSVQAVPEPASLVALGLGAAALLRRRKA